MASNALISVVPQEQDLQLYQGAPFTWNFAVVDSNSNPVNMIGGDVTPVLSSVSV